MKKLVILISGMIVVAITVAACATSRAGYETAPYKVFRSEGDFEIRSYPDLKIATTKLDGDDSSFMRLFRYIDGGNASKEKIAMTTPVFMVSGKMAFVVPEKKKTAPPAPASPHVLVDTMRAQQVAVYRFPGYRSEDSKQEAVRMLKTWLQKQQLQEDGPAFSAYYDPPWTPGFMRRNEVLIPLKTKP